MWSAIGAVFSAIVNAIYSLIAAIANVLGAPGPAVGWNWTVRDQLGNSNPEINDLFKSYMQQEAIKAGQFALRVNGNLVMSTAYTWAEPEYRITETDFVMRIASCSKAFTRAAAFDLIQNGFLNMEDKAFERIGITKNVESVSSTPEPSDPRVVDITVEDLIRHRNGWDYTGDSPNWINDWVFHLKEIGRGMGLQGPPTKREFAQFMFNVNLNYSPDEIRKYSNIGYLLLGLVIEEASGQTYLEFLNLNLLGPLGINDVFVGATRLAGRRDNEVIYEDPHSGPDATLHPADLTAAPLPYGGFGGMTEVMDAGGGLITSANSLSRFINSFSVSGDGTGDEVIASSAGRHNGRRDGGMPGTSAVAKSFSRKDPSRLFDMAFIFNQFDKSTKIGIASGKLDRFVDSLEQSIRSNFGG